MDRPLKIQLASLRSADEFKNHRKRPIHKNDAQILFFLTALAFILPASLGASEELAPDSFEYQLRQRILQNQAKRLFRCKGELICGIADLPRIRKDHTYLDKMGFKVYAS